MNTTFTVRLERTAAGRILARVLPCAQYTVETQADGRKVLSLYDSPGPVEQQKPSTTIAIEDGVNAWVMNSEGATIDTLKTTAARSYR